MVGQSGNKAIWSASQWYYPVSLGVVLAAVNSSMIFQVIDTACWCVCSARNEWNHLANWVAYIVTVELLYSQIREMRRRLCLYKTDCLNWCKLQNEDTPLIIQCYGSNRFGRVEPTRTHGKLFYDPCFLWSSVVWGGSIGLTTPNSCQAPVQAWFQITSLLKFSADNVSNCILWCPIFMTACVCVCLVCLWCSMSLCDMFQCFWTTI